MIAVSGGRATRRVRALKTAANGSHLKMRIFVRDQGETEMQSAGILLYVEDLHEGSTPISGKKTFLG